ncbi:MAG: hypothetical protein ACK5XV_10320 [Flavobacteriales bacterium]|jgi:hypothetical protein
MTRITKINYLLLFVRIAAILALIFVLTLIPFISYTPLGVQLSTVVIVSFLLFTYIRSMIFDTITIEVGNEELVLSRLFGIQKRRYSFDEISGFSDSEIILRMDIKRPRSVILYTKQNTVFEIIDYNYRNFNEIKSFLSQFHHFGFEPYKTGFYFRTYAHRSIHTIILLSYFGCLNGTAPLQIAKSIAYDGHPGFELKDNSTLYFFNEQGRNTMQWTNDTTNKVICHFDNRAAINGNVRIDTTHVGIIHID